MDKYTFTVTLYPQSDEWWEDLEEMPLEKRLSEMGDWIYEVMNDGGIDCKVTNGTYYQMELDL